MDAEFNKHVATGLKGLFGKTEHSNCTIVFTVPLQQDIVKEDNVPTTEAAAEGRDAQNRNVAAGDAGPASTSATATTGDGNDSAANAAGSAEAGATVAGRKRKASEVEEPWEELAGMEGSLQAGQGTSGSSTAAAVGAEARVIGEPLPAHTVVLCLASERFQTQVERWSDDSAVAGPSGMRLAVLGTASEAGQEQRQQQQECGGTQPVPQPQQRPPLLELRVPLGSEEELPAALAAIQFAYTGHIEAGSIREVLQVRQQADYLQMKGCVEACVAAVKQKLAAGAAAKAAATARQQGSQGNSGASNGSGSSVSAGGGSGAAASAKPPVLELFTCTHLWPDPEQEPAFAALLAEAKPQLVAHFGDALAVLNKDKLYDQMLELSAVGLEALLESDDFGTDNESSVVLVLAEWMETNYGSTDAATRRRLCGLLRLAQCSRAYTDWVLPALALDHLLHPDTQAGWFPITPQQAGCVTHYATAEDIEREGLLRNVRDPPCCPEAWFSPTCRRQCLPSDGVAFNLTVKREELCGEFGALGAEKHGWGLRSRVFVHVYGEFGLQEEKQMLTFGLGSVVTLNAGHGQPEAFQLAGTPAPPVAPAAAAPAQEAGGQEGQEAAEPQGEQSQPLEQPQPQPQPQLAQVPRPGEPPQPPQQPQPPQPPRHGEQEKELHEQRRAREAAVATQWARYLRDGRLTGRVVLLPPDSAFAEDEWSHSSGEEDSGEGDDGGQGQEEA
ncbi:hypothetical protein HYH02_011135 [Chlamydomonas schloesseri]|uniref:BACK domain-containing protein n=1 Tax=Chlamydomonas schloesseri TaxID=2026947 RepID=A0A835W5D7_9CHLO|nr:hypothetical protein HYH02_011135 [Chlamydomonas schloesseri]|eukprot:KAG2437759.1 hypothetical protein HYH02_011135 [Chlamydomonas schloesseri]